MDFLFDNESISFWLTQYGSILLFILLVLGIIALPVPEETLMVISGLMMRKGILNIPLTLLAAYAGSMCGITMSYLIGRTAGKYFAVKYGNWIGITHERLEKMHAWFEHYGKWTLVIGYFIPGVRHLTGLSSGISLLKYNLFALFAYSGAILWVTTFISIGYFFGPYGFDYFEHFEVSIDFIFVFALIGLGAYVFYLMLKYYKK